MLWTSNFVLFWVQSLSVAMWDQGFAGFTSALNLVCWICNQVLCVHKRYSFNETWQADEQVCTNNYWAPQHTMPNSFSFFIGKTACEITIQLTWSVVRHCWRLVCQQARTLEMLAPDRRAQIGCISLYICFNQPWRFFLWVPLCRVNGLFGWAEAGVLFTAVTKHTQVVKNLKVLTFSPLMWSDSMWHLQQ